MIPVSPTWPPAATQHDIEQAQQRRHALGQRIFLLLLTVIGIATSIHRRAVAGRRG